MGRVLARLVGRGAAVPHTGVRADPPPARTAADGGGTEYRFVTDGIESALAQARQAAGDREVAVAGGASVVRQYLAAGLLDTLHLHIVPIMLGAGERIFDGVGDPRLEQAAVVAGPTVAHVRYRVLR